MGRARLRVGLAGLGRTGRIHAPVRAADGVDYGPG